MNKFHNRHHQIPRTGSALMIAIFLLALLALLAFLFVSRSEIEKISSRRHAQQTRSRFVAESGLEFAVGRLMEELQYDASRPEDYSASMGMEASYQYGAPSDDGSSFTQQSVPLPHSYYNSFSHRPNHPNADKNGNLSVALQNMTNATGTDEEDNDNDDIVDELDEGGAQYTNHVGYAGELPASISGGKDIYSLRVEDLSSKIYINGPERYPEDPGRYQLAQNQVKLLQNLGRVLFKQKKIQFSDLGRRINRARRELQSDIPNLKALEGTRAFSRYKKDLRVLRNYLTTHAWVDPTTLDPRALKHPRINDPNLILDYSFLYTGVTNSSQNTAFGKIETDRIVSADDGGIVSRRDENIWESGTSEGMENSVRRIPDIPDKKLQPRAPININSAPEPIIRANLMHIQARYLERFHSEPAGKFSSTHPTTSIGKGYRSYHVVRVTPKTAKKIANRLLTRRRELYDHRGYGFSVYDELQDFIYALDEKQQLQQLDPASQVKPIEKWGKQINSPSKRLALQQAIVANINPNSRLPHVNPNFSMGIRFGDVSKADLGSAGKFTGWTTEFSFSSNGYYRISSLGRVLAPGENTNKKQVVSRKTIHAVVKLFDTHKLSTQEEFQVNQVTSSDDEDVTNDVQLYPEPLDDIASASFNNLSREEAASTFGWYDGYFMLPTKDRQKDSYISEQQSRFTLNRGSKARNLGARGPFEYGTSTVNPLVGSNPGGPGNGSSEILPDGFFAHDTRRYGAHRLRKVLEYGAPRWQNGIDDYLRITNLDRLIHHQKGGVLAYMKPTFFGQEFATSLDVNSKRNPAATGTRTVFSFGQGQLACENFNTQPFTDQEYGQNHQAQSESPRRAALFLRRQIPRSVSDNQNPFSSSIHPLRLWGLHKTRLFRAWHDRNIIGGPPEQVPDDYRKKYGNCKNQRTEPRHKLNGNEPFHVDIQTTELLGRPSYLDDYRGGYQSAQKPIDLPSNDGRDPYIQNWEPGDEGFQSGSWKYPGRWHLVGLFWENKRARVYMDGQFGETTFGVDHGVQWKFPETWSFFVGSNRFENATTNGFPLVADATIDDIRIWNKDVPKPKYPPPSIFDRYKPHAMYRGKIGPRKNNESAETMSVPYDGSILNVSWTAYLPQRDTVKTYLRVKVEDSQWIRDSIHPYTDPDQLSDEQNGRGLPVLSSSSDNKPYSFEQGEHLTVTVHLGTKREEWIAETPILDSITVRTKAKGGAQYIYFSSE